MFENRSITFKLAFMVAIPLLFLLAIVGGVYYLSSELEERKEIADTAHDMQVNVINVWQWLTDISVTRAAKGLDDGFTKAEDNHKKFLANLAKLQTHPLMAHKANQLDDIKRNFEEFYVCGKTMADGYIKSGTEKGNELMGKFDESGQALDASMEPFIKEQAELVKKSLNHLHYGSVSAGLIAVLLGIILCWRTARKILIPIQRLTKSSAELASGDLTATVDIDTNDELGQLGRHFNLMARNLTGIVTKIRASSAHVSQAANDTNSASHRSAESIEQESAAMDSIAEQTSEISAQVSSVSSQVEQLSAGIEQASATLDSQFDFVNRTSATIEEMAASASSVADRAEHAKSLSINSVKQADAGSKAVEKAISGMLEISATVQEMSAVIEKLGRRSDQIGEILHTINSIAAQTNLLALNAAIEAARAGEHGRGFAVVADEVRKLAEGTAGATEEIAEIVRGIQAEAQDAIQATKLGKEKIVEGTSLTQSVGKVLTTLIDSINNASQAVEEIAAASEEQKSAAEEAAKSVQELKGMSEQISIGVKEESKSINEISIATSETAKAVQGSASALQQIKSAIELSSQGVMELAASAEKLQEQSQDLSGLISSFKVDESAAEKIVAGQKQSSGGGSKGMQQLGGNQNCWDYKKCGREKGGAKVSEFGVCPAYPDKGKNCATVAGTFCGGKVQGAFASKIRNCAQCDFYNSESYGKI